MIETPGKRIQKMRKQKHLSITDISEAIGISHQELVEIEQSKKPLSDEALTKFATVLKVDVTYLKEGNVFIDHSDDLIDAFQKLAMEEQHDFIALFSTLRKPKK